MDVTHSKIKQKCFFRNSYTPLNQGDDTWVLKFPCVQKINIRSAKAKCDIAHHSRRKIKIELLLPIWKIYHHQCDCRCRAVGAGGGGDIVLYPPYFGRSTNPFSTRGSDYTHHIITGPSLFSDLPIALGWWCTCTDFLPLCSVDFFFQFDSFSTCETQFLKSGLYFFFLSSGNL